MKKPTFGAVYKKLKAAPTTGEGQESPVEKQFEKTHGGESKEPINEKMAESGKSKKPNAVKNLKALLVSRKKPQIQMSGGLPPGLAKFEFKKK